MRKLKAFLIAFALFIVTVFGCHFYVNTSSLSTDNRNMDYWMSTKKYLNPDGIEANLDENSIVVFGSSELVHGKSSCYYPKEVLKGQDFRTMLVGEGYYQSLAHAMTLASIADEMPNKRVILFVSPSWFKTAGVEDKAFASRFSELAYLEMIDNENISNDVKEYIAERTQTLLEPDPKMQEKIASYNNAYLYDTASINEVMMADIRSTLCKEHSNFSFKTGSLFVKKISQNNSQVADINWDTLYKNAEADGKVISNNNEFYMCNSTYNSYISKIMDDYKDISQGRTYGESPEYGDLKCFLDVCKELDVEVMLILIPVNGYWYDYTGFPQEGRNDCYERVRSIAEEYDVELSDLSSNEYTPYFFEDGVHLALKGWVSANESIYNFATEN